MGNYIYRYMHPDYPWLYVGKNNNELKTRINQHDRSNADNIDREYKTLLLESTVYYIELDNATQTNYVEQYLIDKYKPFLNKNCKTDSTLNLTMELPKWKKMIRSCDLEDTYIDKKSTEKEINRLKNEYLKLQNEKEKIFSDINSLSLDLKNIKENKENLVKEEFSEVSREEIEEFYKSFPESKITFSQKLKDKTFIFSREKLIITDEDNNILYSCKRCDEELNMQLTFDMISFFFKFKPSSMEYYYEIENLKKQQILNNKKIRKYYLKRISDFPDGWYISVNGDIRLLIFSGNWELIKTKDKEYKNNFSLEEKDYNEIQSILEDENIIWVNESDYKERM